MLRELVEALSSVALCSKYAASSWGLDSGDAIVSGY
jgi:hypothetical protein